MECLKYLITCGMTVCVFNIYIGSPEKVNLSSPEGVALNLWTTALAMKIMELLMAEKNICGNQWRKKAKKILYPKSKGSEDFIYFNAPDVYNSKFFAFLIKIKKLIYP